MTVIFRMINAIQMFKPMLLADLKDIKLLNLWGVQCCSMHVN